ncbi:MAG: hypothetical protein LBJ02_08320 [Bifidobacteriaceae bacterium]|nr:hypothetical protein [Bifidobacteriaceae bacterium]
MYTDEKNAQIVLALLKAHGIRSIVASPGTTNVQIVASAIQDSDFDVYSVVDERSAGYFALGLASENNCPVVLSCTGATASRNYLSALTEAFYRDIPLIALTSVYSPRDVGHLAPQVIDRSVSQNDVKRFSVQLPIVKDWSDFQYCALWVNTAIIEARRHGGGPVHINLPTVNSGTFSTRRLPRVPKIDLHEVTPLEPMWEQSLVETLKCSKVAVFIGSHRAFSESEMEAISAFSSSFDAPILVDHTSSYRGKGSILTALALVSVDVRSVTWRGLRPDVLIHIGQVSGDYPLRDLLKADPPQVWRVDASGQIKDAFGGLRRVFACDELSFFRGAAGAAGRKSDKTTSYRVAWSRRLRSLQYPAVPLSAAAVAAELAGALPHGSYLHLGILNTLRNWNFFPVDPSVRVSCNVGGFGIDGAVSTLVGAAVHDSESCYFGVLGDLAFYYDMGGMNISHVGPNVRLVVVNNGVGMEFKLPGNIASQFGAEAGTVLAADAPRAPIRAWAEACGFVYLRARTADELSKSIAQMVSAPCTDGPFLLEVLTTVEGENEALAAMARANRSWSLNRTLKEALPSRLKRPIKKVLGR